MTEIDIMLPDEVCRYIRQHRLFLCYADADRLVDIWSCGRQLPLSLRRSLFAYKWIYYALMEQSNIEVCPNPGLHRRWWRYRGKQCYTCDACERLRPWVC